MFGLIAGLAALPWAAAQTSFPQAAPVSGTQVGVIAGVKGVVQISSGEKIGREVQSGAPIYLGDEVKTGSQGQLQILLMDESVFTIGPDSAIVIDTFIYDPDSHDGKIQAKIVKGSFRAVTGLIGKKEPRNVEVKLPAGSVGIRGTIFCGHVEGFRSEILLLGPGEQTAAGQRVGAILVSNEVNGSIVGEQVDRAGFGSIIEGQNIPPTPAFEFNPVQIQQMLAPLIVEKQDEESSSEDSSEVRSDDKTDTKDDAAGETVDSTDSDPLAAKEESADSDAEPDMAERDSDDAAMKEGSLSEPVDSMKSLDGMDDSLMTDSTGSMEGFTEDSFEAGLGGEESFKTSDFETSDMSATYDTSYIDQTLSDQNYADFTNDLEKQTQDSSQDQTEQMISIQQDSSGHGGQASPTPSISISI